MVPPPPACASPPCRDCSGSAKVRIHPCGCSYCKDCYIVLLSQFLTSARDCRCGLAVSSYTLTKVNNGYFHFPIMQEDKDAESPKRTKKPCTKKKRKRTACSAGHRSKKETKPAANPTQQPQVEAKPADNAAKNLEEGAPDRALAQGGKQEEYAGEEKQAANEGEAVMSADEQKLPPMKKGRTWRKTPFEVRMAHLQAYKNDHGTCNVPDEWPQNPALANWVSHVRRGNVKLSSNQRQQLVNMGFDFEGRKLIWDRQWHVMYGKLQVYRAQTGDCNVPFNYPPDQSLRDWVGTQRKQFKKGRLKPLRRQALEKIGFDFAPGGSK